MNLKHLLFLFNKEIIKKAKKTRKYKDKQFFERTNI